MGSTPGWGTKIPHVTQYGKKQTKEYMLVWALELGERLCGPLGMPEFKGKGS